MVDHYISLERAIKRMYAVTEEFGTQHIFIDRIVDELENIPSCPISTPAVPGPKIADPNIMELCFHNGERHMKEKVLSKLKDFSAEILFEEQVSGEVTVVTFEHVIRMLEDL